MNDKGSVTEELGNKKDAIFKCLRCGIEIKLPESIYCSGSPSLVKGSSMYPQNDILYPQLFGTKNHGCIHNHSFCVRNKAYYKEKIRSPIRYIEYKIYKIRKECSIGQFVSTPRLHHNVFLRWLFES